MQSLSNFITANFEAILVVLVGILFLANIAVLLFRRDRGELSSFSDILLRGQAELAGRLSQLSEHSSQEQNKIAQAISEQKMAVLKIMDEKLLAVTKSVGEGLQQTTAKTTETLTDLRERLAKSSCCRSRLCPCRKSFPTNRRAAPLAKYS